MTQSVLNDLNFDTYISQNIDMNTFHQQLIPPCERMIVDTT